MRKLKIAIILPLLLAGGCWDQLELEEQAFVVVLGLDKGPRNTVEVTFQIANPQVGSSDIGTSDKEPPSDTISFTASDILSAKELANSAVTRTINFAHLKALIVHEELARSDWFPHLISAAIRDPEMRREVTMIVTRERAYDFIKNNRPQLETRPHKYFELMKQRWKETGYVPFSTLNQYLQRQVGDTMFLAIYATAEQISRRVKPGEDDYIAGQVPKRSGDPVQMMGAGVFQQGRMTDILNGQQIRWMQVVRQNTDVGAFIVSFPDPLDRRSMVTVRLFKEKDAKVKMDLRREVPVINVSISLRSQILSIASLKKYATDFRQQQLLHRYLVEEIQNQVMELVRYSQQKLKGDPFEWELLARRHFATLKAFSDYKWPEKFSKAEVHVNVDLRIENFGKQRAPYVNEGRGD